jgi:hypothetical protein
MELKTVSSNRVLFLKGLRFYVEAEDPDMLVFTETKLQAEPDSSDTLYLKQKYKVPRPSSSIEGSSDHGSSQYRYWGALV